MKTELWVDQTGEKIYPNCYLYVEECRSGESWIMTIGPQATLNIEERVKQFIKLAFCGELKLDGKIQQPVIGGDFYAKIVCNGLAPDDLVCWDSCNFWLTTTY